MTTSALAGRFTVKNLTPAGRRLLAVMRGHVVDRSGRAGSPLSTCRRRETPLMKFSQLTNRVRRWMQNRGVVS